MIILAEVWGNSSKGSRRNLETISGSPEAFCLEKKFQNLSKSRMLKELQLTCLLPSVPVSTPPVSSSPLAGCSCHHVCLFISSSTHNLSPNFPPSLSLPTTAVLFVIKSYTRLPGNSSPLTSELIIKIRFAKGLMFHFNIS